MTREELIEKAREQWATDDIEIDDNAQTVPSGNRSGHWVQAWVYVEIDEENLNIELDDISHINE